MDSTNHFLFLNHDEKNQNQNHLIKQENSKIIIGTNNETIYIPTTLQVDNTINIKNNLNVEGNTNLRGDLKINGNLYFEKDLKINGHLHLQKDLNIHGNINVGKEFRIISDLNAEKNVHIHGNLHLEKDLKINGNFIFEKDLHINGNINEVPLQGSLKMNNLSIGKESFFSNIDGENNISIGYKSLSSNKNTSNNTAIGALSIQLNTEGDNNTAIGYQAHQSGKVGCSNTFIGAFTDIDCPNSYYEQSTAIGYQSIITDSNQITLGTNNEYVYIPGTEDSIDCNTGALKVSGGVGINGNIHYAGELKSMSDYRVKENIQLLDESYTVDMLKPVIYNKISSHSKEIGFLAHELQEIYPFLVSGEKDGKEMQTVNYLGIIGILVREIQELKKKVKNLST
jgi:cytoskeletal protein CcmA (bactofilin family)